MKKPTWLARIVIALNVLCALLISAHFLRSGQITLVSVCLLSPLLFFWRRRTSLFLLQLFAFASSVTWIWTAAGLVAHRMAIGQSWTAALIILGAVAAAAALAGWLLRLPAVTDRYPQDPA